MVQPLQCRHDLLVKNCQLVPVHGGQETSFGFFTLGSQGPFLNNECGAFATTSAHLFGAEACVSPCIWYTIKLKTTKMLLAADTLKKITLQNSLNLLPVQMLRNCTEARQFL